MKHIEYMKRIKYPNKSKILKNLKCLCHAADVKERCISLLFPRRCPVCGDVVPDPGDLICPACVGKLSPVSQPACKKCGKEVLHQRMEYCLDCNRHSRTFETGAALLNYNEAARRSMAAVKYKNRREYLDFYAAALARRFERRVRRWNPAVLVPVPVHPSRRRRRGFNQAEELARRLGRLWQIPVDSQMLVRSRKTAPQRDLNPEERLRNLQHAFIFGKDCVEIPETVLLVDDIYTTGSTVEACSRVLKAAGVRKVYFVAICIGGGR